MLAIAWVVETLSQSDTRSTVTRHVHGSSCRGPGMMPLMDHAPEILPTLFEKQTRNPLRLLMCASHQCLFQSFSPFIGSHQKIQSSLKGGTSNSSAASAPSATGFANSGLPVNDGLFKRLRESVHCGSSPTLCRVSVSSKKGGDRVMSRSSEDALVKFSPGIFAFVGGCCIVLDS
jgi:hypothetical protein